MPGLRLILAASLIACSAGCAFFSPAAPHKPVGFQKTWSPPRAPAFPNWPLPPDEALREVDDARKEDAVRADEVKGAGGGTTGAKQALFYFPDVGKDVAYKIKRVPSRLDGINNAPRKEVAAYAIQRLFLDPEDYVVPTTTMYCLDIDWMDHQEIRHGGATLEDTKCVLVAASLWLQDLTLRDPIYDEARFLRDPAYAYYLSNFNVLTYVIGHRDGRQGNFLYAKDDDRPQLFAIDNGSTFNPWGYNYFVANWDVIRVASVRKETVDRLRKLERGDLDFLRVVLQMQIDSEGKISKVEPGPSLDDDEGALREGDVVQFGLTKKEIDKVWKRIQKLIEQVDDGSLPVF